MSVWPSARCTFTPAGMTIMMSFLLRGLLGELPLHLGRTAARRRKDAPSIIEFNRHHAVRRPHEIAQSGER